MPWLKQVLKLGKFRLMKSHTNDYFIEWDGRTTRLPRIRIPSRLRHRRRGA